MRLLTLSFASSADFLTHYTDAKEHGAIFFRTRTELDKGEAVVMEIGFPELPDRAHVRGVILGTKEGKGMWIQFDPADAPKRDFLLKLARGEVEADEKRMRAHLRFPADVPVKFRPEGGGGEHTVARSTDLSAADCFVVSDAPPEVGSRIELLLGPLGERAEEPFALVGEVVRTNSHEGEQGFVVHLDPKAGPDASRFRAFLRNASETGRLRF